MVPTLLASLTVTGSRNIHDQTREPTGPTPQQEWRRSWKGKVGIQFAWQGMVRLQKGSDIGGTSWRMSGISTDRGCRAEHLQQREGILQPNLSELTWVRFCQNKKRSWINSQPWYSFFVTVSFPWNEWSFLIFLSLLFSSLGYSGRLFYLPLMNWPVQRAFQLSFMEQGQNISFTHTAQTKSSFSFSFFFPLTTSSLFVASEKLLCGSILQPFIVESVALGCCQCSDTKFPIWFWAGHRVLL